ncbi:MAG: hypothetical protein WCA22_13450 [Candidatus Binatus sp.]
MLETFIGALNCPTGGHIDRLRRQICPLLVVTLAAAVAVWISGCWMAAAQLAPIAANVAEDVGGGALELAAGVGASTHRAATQAKQEEEARESAMNGADSCDQLEVEVPGVIELRRSAAGAPEYRELQVSDSIDQPQWAPIADSETTPDGWRPAVNFLQMNFSPPLGAVVPEKASSFLAYAPSRFITAADSDRLTAMTSNFGKPVGTFTWDGQYYHYVVTSTLPCFPPPPERIAQDVTAPSGF